MISVILDALVIFVFIITILLAYRRGFLRTVLILASSLGAIFGAVFFSNLASGWVFETFFRDNVLEKVSSAIGATSSPESIAQAVQGFSDLIPDVMSSFLFQGRTVAEVTTHILQQNPGNAAVSLTDQLVAPVFTFLISCVLFFIFFIIIKLMFRFLIHLFGVVKHIPIIGKINGILGALVGVLEGFLVLFIVGTVLYFIILVTGGSLSWMNQSIVDQTNLFLLFYNFNPLHML